MKINTYGADKIGGCITEVISEKARVIIDYGSNLNDTEQIDLKGVTSEPITCDAVFISHYHMDHIGEIKKISEKVPVYIEKTTEKIYEIICDFSNKDKRKIKTFNFKEMKTIGDLEITAYKVDHSAYNSAMFFIKDTTTGETALYTGDFRNNGYSGDTLIPTIREIVNKNDGKIDFLITEGTNIGNNTHILKKEESLVNEFAEIFHQYNQVFVMMSASNIDRITTLIKAANKEKHTLIQDIYMAHLTSTIYLNDKKNIPNPISFPDVMVYKPLYFEHKDENFKKKYLNSFDNKNNNYMLHKPFVMNVRTSMLDDLKTFKYSDSQEYSKKIYSVPILNNACLVYSMWGGYKEKEEIKKFIKEAESLGIKLIPKDIHTSGHASEELIEEVKQIVKPREVYIIHTEIKNKKERGKIMYTEKQIEEMLNSNLLYQKKCINYTGKTKEGNYFIEFESAYITKNKDKIRKNGELQYSECYVRDNFNLNHNKDNITIDENSNRYETNLCRNLYKNEFDLGVMGKVVEYEVNVIEGDHTNIDLVSYNENGDLYLIEVKGTKGKKDKSNQYVSDETLLRCILEISTYYNSIKPKIDKFKEGLESKIKGGKIKNIKLGILVPDDSEAYKEYKNKEDYPQTNSLLTNHKTLIDGDVKEIEVYSFSECNISSKIKDNK